MIFQLIKVETRVIPIFYVILTTKFISHIIFMIHGHLNVKSPLEGQVFENMIFTK